MNKTCNLKFCLISLFCLIFSAIPALNTETINFVRLDVNNGLSNNEINAIHKDRTGFIWFGTGSGLNRFDGYQFRVVRNTSENPGIAEANIKNIQESADSCLWLRYYDSQFDVYNLQTGTFIPVNKKLQSYDITDTIGQIFTDIDYNLICLNDKNQIIRYDYNSQSITRFDAFTYATDSNDMVTDIYSTIHHYYLIYNSGRLLILTKEMDRVLTMNDYLYNESGSLYRLFVDNDQDIWIYPDPALNMGAYYFQKETGTYHHLHTQSDRWKLSGNIIRGIEQDTAGRIWIATDHAGINILDKKTKTVQILKNSAFNPTSISQNSIVSLYRDSDGIMWAGTYKNGVNYYHESIFKFSHLKYPAIDSDEQAYNDCSCVYEDPSGNLWIGTNGGGLLHYNRTTGKYTTYKHNPKDKNSICGDIIISMTCDTKGNLWLGSFLNGMDKFDGRTFTHYTVENTNGQLSNNSVYTLLTDSKGRIWSGTLGGGLNCYNPDTGEWKNYRSNSTTHSIISDYITSLIETPEGEIIAGTFHGVNIIDNQTGEVREFTGNRSGTRQLNTAIVNSLLWDSRKLLWLGTNNGLIIYDTVRDTFYTLDKTTGLPGNNTMSLKEDAMGDVWTGFRNGMCRISLSNQQTGYQFAVQTFDEEDGLQGRDFNINSVYRNTDNELIFGGTNGITIINTANIKYNTIPPIVTFTDFRVNNKQIHPGETINGRILLKNEICYEKHLQLKSNERNISVEVSALNFPLPGKTHYEYKMSGFDKEWISLEENNRRIQYTNLSPGNYSLMVKACNNDGLWSAEPTVLDITISPPFYSTYWAIMFYVIIVALLLYLFFSYWTNRQQKIFREKEERAAIRQMHEIDEMKLRFFTNVSHEFRTPLTLILNPLERLIKKTDNQEDSVLLHLIYQNAGQLLNLVNQLLDFRKIDMKGHVLTLSVGDIIPFIRDAVYSFKDLSERKNIRFSFSSAFNSLEMKFDKDKVYKIIINLLSNAFKFTPDGGEINVNVSIRTSATSSPDELLIKVTDSGIGIATGEQKKIFERFYQFADPESDGTNQGTGIGLHLCKEFVKLHNGEIEVESEIGKGAVFTVSLPILSTDVHEIISRENSPAGEFLIPLNPETSPVLPESEPDSTSRPVLLVIDDNPDFRNFMVISLQDRYTVYQAPEGETAWQLLLKELPDMVICDVMMPGINGFDLCRKIKTDIHTSHIPVILLTAKSAEDSKIKGFEAGADDYIGKPFNMDMLLLKIQNLIETRRKIQTRIIQQSGTGIQLKEVEINSLDEQLIQKSITYIEENLSSPTLNVERLSQEMGMSRVHYYKKITAITGKSPVELIRTVRLKHAARLLQKSQKRVGEIALETGFNDIKLFRKYFKEEFGVLPSDYNNQNTNNPHF